MRIGLFGFPLTGKTTLFELLTGATAPAHGARGEAQVGAARVPDPRLDRLATMYRPKKYTPAVVEYLDLAGMNKGEAARVLPLDQLRTVDALAHVVRAFGAVNAVPLNFSAYRPSGACWGEFCPTGSAPGTASVACSLAKPVMYGRVCNGVGLRAGRRLRPQIGTGRKLVGARGFEPPTPCTPCKCATRLRHAPTERLMITNLGL